MPSIDSNQKTWKQPSAWRNNGDEWSEPWGTTKMQWYGSILPRIMNHLPCEHILEIACGYGRWTQFLLQNSLRLTAVDLVPECISACRSRFSGNSNFTCFENDGKSLSMIPDHSVDFVFSFDSLVHANIEVIQAYIEQLSRILKPNGKGFLHHSNLGQYAKMYARTRHVRSMRPVLSRLGILETDYHWRDWSVSADKVRKILEISGLNCNSQETVNWRTRNARIDCFTTFSLGNKQVYSQMKNSDFMREAHYLKTLSHLYDK
jgi:ubiquinone/menaquinone biosynthesis C-methylase UbiE